MSRPVRVGTCRNCTVKTLTGDDSDHLGVRVTVDAKPIGTLGEALAVLTGRRTYDLIPCRGDRGGVIGSELEERTPSLIRTGRSIPRPIHAEHRCNQPLPTIAPAQTTAAAWASTGTEF